MTRLVTIVGALLICVSASGEKPTGLKVGTAVVKIDPDVFPFQLRSGPSSHVHDSLHVRAVAFENGEGRVAIAVIDAIGYGRQQCDRAKIQVAQKTGWKPEQMLIS